MKSGLESLYPDNTRFYIGMHYQSDITDEYATFHITKAMSIEDVLGLYARYCPIECRIFLAAVAETNKNLYRPGGMSKEGVIMAIGKIPEIVMKMIDFLDPDFFIGAENATRNFRRFLRAFPKFAVGDHSSKHHSGVLVK